jgi:hypothetical protein
MKSIISRFLPLLFFAGLLSACGTQQADASFESIAPARLLALQSALAVARADLNLDAHPNPMDDAKYFALIEPDFQALHRATREVGDIEKDVKKSTGVSSGKYSGMDGTLTQIALLGDELTNYFAHPKDAGMPAYQNVQKSLASLTDALAKALQMYAATGGLGLPTPELTPGTIPIATVTPS